VLAVARENAVERIVVGLPRSLDGSLGRQAQAVQAFAQLLAGRSDVPVVTWDERFSTVAADKMLAEAGVKRAKRKARRDSTAAAFILQGYLDHEKGDSVGGG
jgi:putative Holliday junction resolvase